MGVIIEACDLVKTYGDLRAVDRLSLDVPQGTILSPGAQGCRQDDDRGDPRGTPIPDLTPWVEAFVKTLYPLCARKPESICVAPVGKGRVSYSAWKTRNESGVGQCTRTRPRADRSSRDAMSSS